MSVAAARTAAFLRLPGFPLSSRFALRELRGGLRGFYIFFACIILGTATIAGVGSLAQGLTASIAREGRAIAGGDVVVSLTQRLATPEEKQFFAEAGRVSTVATLRSMLRTDEASPLVELKGVEPGHPLVGQVRIASGRPLEEVLQTGLPTVPVVVEPSLLAASGLKVGDDAKLGNIGVRIADLIEAEPDKLAGGIAFGPRVLMPIGDLERSGLVAPGSLVRWHYRIVGREGPLTDGEVKAFAADAKRRFPSAGWRIETREDAAPSLKESIERFAQFLTLVGLTSLTVGGVGVANAVRSHLGRRRMVMAILRVLGASPAFVVAVYLQQIMLLAFAAVVVGVATGAAVPPVAALILGDILPVSALDGVFPTALAGAFVYGMLSALTFALWPLAAAHGVRPIVLLRDVDERGRLGGRFMIAAILAGLCLALVAVAGAFDRTVAAVAIAGIAVMFALLRGVAAILMQVARRIPRPRSVVLRLAIANLHRRDALTSTVTLSLGLSLTLLATLSLVDGNLRTALVSRLPAQAPSFFFIDIKSGQVNDFTAALQAAAPAGKVETEPMLRGRIVSINGIAAEDWPEGEASWVLRGDRGITYAAALPEGSKVAAGAWWAGEPLRNEVSFDANLAGELGVSVGDTVKVNVLGREIEATISNLRTVDWQTLGINFVMVFSPNVFAGAPHANLATLSMPAETGEAGEIATLKSISRDFPTVTSIRVKDALATVNRIVEDLVLGVRAAAALTLVASMLVLAGTLAASHRSRIYDAVVLKTLGARRWTIICVYALEYALLGMSCAVFALIGGAVAGWAVITQLMNLEFIFMTGSVITTVSVAIALTVGLGLIGTWRVLGEKPAKVLRNL